MMLVLLRFMRWSLAVACVCIGVVGIVVVFVGGVIDGNGDGIWWQVLAVAFRRHWAVGGQVLAVDGLPSLFQPRCDTLGLGLVAPGYTRPCGAVEWNNKQRCHQQHMMICSPQGHWAKAWQGGQERYRCHAKLEGFGQLGCYNLCQLVSFIRSQPTTSQLSLAAATRFFAHTQTSLVD